MIQKSVSVLSGNMEVFEEEAPYYQNILRQCGYVDTKLEFDPPLPSKRRRKRRRATAPQKTLKHT